MNTNANIAIQILPNMPDDQETVRVVDEVIASIKGTGLQYFVGPSETCVEGEDLHQLLEVLETCMKAAAQAGSEKVSAYVKLIWKPHGTVLTIHEKTAKHQQ